MFEWVNAALPGPADIPAVPQFGQLLRAAVMGVAVAAVYFLTQRKPRAEAAPFVATLVLLTILIAMVTLVIGDNVARAFSLAGALAIIRFRTVVDDTRDTAFVIAAVVTGMAIGADQMKVALAGFPIIAVAAMLLSVWGRGAGRGVGSAALVIRAGIGTDPTTAIAVTLVKHLQDHRLISAATARQGVAIDLTYAVRLKAGASALALIAELNRTEGVQGVEWKETAGESRNV